jgi:hypothetical protein
MKNRSAILLLALAISVMLALTLAACGGSESAGPSGDNSSQGNASAPQNSLSVLSDSSAGQPYSANRVDSANAPTPAPRAGGSGVSGGGGGSAGGVTGSASLDRKITRNASLDLTVDNVLDSVQKVEDIATSAGGFVSNSSLAVTDTQEGEGIQTASVKIRVPADSYSDVMTKLRAVAKEVRSENSDTQEVTEEYTDLQSRLRNLQATEQRYLDLLSRAATINDILSLEDRLTNVRGEVEQVQGRIKVLDDLTDLATISVRLALPIVAAKTQDESQGWVQEAWSESWNASRDVLIVVGSIAIATVVFLPWVVVPTLIGFAAWRSFGRRITDLAGKAPGQEGGAG